MARQRCGDLAITWDTLSADQRRARVVRLPSMFRAAAIVCGLDPCWCIAMIRADSGLAWLGARPFLRGAWV